MFYLLLYPLHSDYRIFNVFRYITFRTAMAVLSALLVSFILGPGLIRRLRQFQIGQEIREEGPASHQAKRGTPTMGGLLVITAVVLPTLLWADLRNVFVWISSGLEGQEASSSSAKSQAVPRRMRVSSCAEPFARRYR